MTEDEMVGWHHQFNGYEFDQALGNSEGQGSLACCSPWGHKESEMTERLTSHKRKGSLFVVEGKDHLGTSPSHTPPPRKE